MRQVTQQGFDLPRHNSRLSKINLCYSDKMSNLPDLTQKIYFDTEVVLKEVAVHNSDLFKKIFLIKRIK